MAFRGRDDVKKKIRRRHESFGVRFTNPLGFTDGDGDGSRRREKTIGTSPEFVHARQFTASFGFRL